MSYADQLRDEGRREGRLEGRQEGLALGQRAAYRKMLTLRYGGSSDALDQLLDACDADDLEWLAEAILTTETLAQLQRRLQQRLVGRSLG